MGLSEVVTVDKEKRTPKESKDDAWFGKVISMVEQGFMDLSAIPQKVGEVDTEGAIYGTLVHNAALISMTENYKETIRVAHKSIMIRDEETDSEDGGEAWAAYTQEELRDYILFMEAVGKVRGIMLDFLMKNKPTHVI